MDAELIAATVTVPQARLADLLEFAAQMVREQDKDKAEVEESPRGGTRRWASGDDSIAAAVIRATKSPAALALWAALAKSSPHHRLTGDDLNKLTQKDWRGRNGVLGRMARSCLTRGRELTWSWDPQTNTYWMVPEVAQLFKRSLALVARERKDAGVEL